MGNMTYVQLGWLQTAISYVYDNALAPVFDKISSVIESILKTLFNNPLMSLLQSVFGWQVEFIKTMLANVWFEFLYRTMRSVLWVLDAIEQCFRLFAGLDPIYVQDSSGQMQKSGSLITALVRNPSIWNAMLAMMAVSFVLCFMTAIIATVRSLRDMGGDGKRSFPINKVMRLTGQALFRLILIPFLSLFLIGLGDVILKSIDTAMNPAQTRVSDILFTMSTLDAVRVDDYDDAAVYNSTTRAAALAGKDQSYIKSVSDFGLTDKYRKDFYYRGTSKGAISEIYEAAGIDSTPFMQVETPKRDLLYKVLEVFDIRKMDYMISIGCAVIFIYIFGTLAISMIARAFDLVLLILAEPFFAATIPLNDGEQFKKWQEVFLGRLVSCYGSIVAINLYLGIISIIFENKVSFFGEGTTPAVVYLVNLLFVLTGAYAIIKVGPVITGIMSSESAEREGEMSSAGDAFTSTVLGFAGSSYRKIAMSAYGKGLNAALTSYTTRGIKDGGDPRPGAGDAFGSGTVSYGEGNQFGGTKTEANGKTIITGTGSGADIEATPFNGQKNDGGKVSSGTVVSPGAGAGAFDGANKKNYTNPQPGMAHPSYSFLISEPTRGPQYTWIGQRDKQEREEEEAMDKLLKEELDMNALLAAESKTGVDPNGDGIVTETEDDLKSGNNSVS